MVKMEEAQVVGDIQNIWNAEYEAYVDEVITDPLIAKLPAPGKIKASQRRDSSEPPSSHSPTAPVSS